VVLVISRHRVGTDSRRSPRTRGTIQPNRLNWPGRWACEPTSQHPIGSTADAGRTSPANCSVPYTAIAGARAPTKADDFSDFEASGPNAHSLTPGGQAERDGWLRGIEKIQKRQLLLAVARNLGLIMRSLFTLGTPQSLQGQTSAREDLVALVYLAWLVTNPRRTAVTALGHWSHHARLLAIRKPFDYMNA
jgi:hypothetical protein